MTGKWELVINNIGAFSGEHKFILKDGVNIVGSPNATGKTSIINSLRLLSNNNNESFLNRVLNNSSIFGKVTLSNNNREFFVEINRTENSVIVNREKLLNYSEQIDNIAFLTGENPFFIAVEREASQKKIKEWLYQVTDLNYYEKAFNINSKIHNDYLIRLEKEKSNINIVESQLELQLSTLNKEKVEIEKRLAKLRKAGVNQNEVDKVKEKFTKNAREIELIKNRIKRYSTDLLEAESQLPVLQKELDNITKELDDKQSLLENAEEEIYTRQKQIIKIDEEIDKNKDNFLLIKNKLGRLSVIKDEIDKAIENKQEKCQFCNNIMSQQDNKKYLSKINNDIDKQEILLQKHTNRKVELISMKRKISEEILVLQRELPVKIKQIENSRKDTQRKLNHIKEIISTHPEKKGIEEKQLLEKEIQNEKLQTQLTDLTSDTDENKKIQRELLLKLKQIRDKINKLDIDLFNLKFSNKKIKGIEILISKTKEIGKAIQKKISFIQEEIIDKINKRIKESYEAIELIGFSSIIITDDFNLKIKRRSGIKANFDELSGMERVLMGIIITFSTLQAFYPDFPLFAIDDPLNAADDLRFKKLINYLANQISLLIVTRNIIQDKSNLSMLTQRNILTKI